VPKQNNESYITPSDRWWFDFADFMNVFGMFFLNVRIRSLTCPCATMGRSSRANSSLSFRPNNQIRFVRFWHRKGVFHSSRLQTGKDFSIWRFCATSRRRFDQISLPKDLKFLFYVGPDERWYNSYLPWLPFCLLKISFDLDKSFICDLVLVWLLEVMFLEIRQVGSESLGN